MKLNLSKYKTLALIFGMKYFLILILIFFIDGFMWLLVGELLGVVSVEIIRGVVKNEYNLKDIKPVKKTKEKSTG